MVVLNLFRDRVKCELNRMSSRVISTELAGASAVNPKVSAFEGAATGNNRVA